MGVRQVWLVGFGGDLPARVGAGWQRLPIEKLRRAFVPCAEGAVVVIGSLAARAVSPELVESLAYSPYVRVLVVASSGAERGTWGGREWAGLVAPEVMTERIEEVNDLPSRRALPLRLWAPRALREDPSLEPSIRALARSPAPAFVASWMRTLGRDRHFVTRCLEQTDWTAKALCLRYGRAYWTQETARNVPEGWIAAHLGYCRVSVMRTALGVARSRETGSARFED